MQTNNGLLLLLFLLLALANYQASLLISKLLPNAIYPFSLAIIWLLIAVIPYVLTRNTTGLSLDIMVIKRHWRVLTFYFSVIIAGLLVFILLGLTRYFHNVKYPLFFSLITPLAEELIFRGSLFNYFERFKKHSPVVITALLFALHHLQYTNYHLTLFAIFQVIYTFILGVLLGKLRKQSKSIYPGLVAHILINGLSYLY